MMRYKSFTYSCRCCETTGKGRERFADKRIAQQEIQDQLDSEDEE